MRRFTQMTQEDETEKLQVELYQHPQSGQFVRLAELYLGSDRPEDAITLIYQSLKFHPQSISGLILLGRAFRKTTASARRRQCRARTLELLGSLHRKLRNQPKLFM